MIEKKNTGKGCGCGSNFKKEINSMVKEATKPTASQRQHKKEEVEKAFSQKTQKK